MPIPTPNEDELIAILSRSDLPTVLVEGGTDMIIYRYVENKIGISDVSFLPCGGRGMLLAIHNRRSEYSELPVAFVADRDMWYFTNIPDEYNDIVWTTGYSIENDVYEPSSVESLLDDDEVEGYADLISGIAAWIAFESQEYIEGRSAHVATSIREIFPNGNSNMSQRFIDNRGFVRPIDTRIDEIVRTYKMAVRGKTLFDALLVFLSSAKRRSRHSRGALLEIALKTTANHPHLERIAAEIKNSMGCT